MHSVIVGINQGIVLICQAVFFIMTFIIILEWVNNTLIWFGDRIGVENMTAEVSLWRAGVPVMVCVWGFECADACVGVGLRFLMCGCMFGCVYAVLNVRVHVRVGVLEC
ncbi:hypothetical protein DPMN_011616 [Dreissena polymorpha]|uniref:Transmembrane protein n=1 Tax=Dreissena polymorpha TaxID=45954 RepID=A0A9D4N0W9_DREPO|nr:hypothetical protein DPMN_011616 [Dreissena polymorpha]